MLMLDLCCGLKGASQAMRDRGWQVVTLDIDPIFEPDIVADLRAWSWYGARPDLIWISPPCTEFARESMPWCRTGQQPDLAIINAARRTVAETPCHMWVIENVRGAQPYLGPAQIICGPFYLWTNLPPLGMPLRRFRKKESYSSSAKAERARVPYELSLAVALATESQLVLFEEVINGDQNHADPDPGR